MSERLARVTEQSLRALDDTGDAEQRQRQAYSEFKRSFAVWNAALDNTEAGPSWLSRPEVASLVAEALQQRDGHQYHLFAYCIMPNHVHAVFTPLHGDGEGYHSLASIMRSLKGRTAREANLVLGRTGAFWQHENYDHVVRDEEELGRIIDYVLENPVKAGLVQAREEWNWSYSMYEL